VQGDCVVERREVLANVLWIAVVLLELDPAGLGRQLPQIGDESCEVLGLEV
jgi:hypothetical protein